MMRASPSASLRTMQMATLVWSGCGSFLFSMFKWFFSASGANCNGWDKFPTFGLKALKWTWQYDWSLTYIGVGAALCLLHLSTCIDHLPTLSELCHDSGDLQDQLIKTVYAEHDQHHQICSCSTTRGAALGSGASVGS